MSIARHIHTFRSQLPDHVELVAVSKTHPAATIREAYEAGQRHFGENKVQELIAKAPGLPDDVCWHLIGHLQTNKVKYIADIVHLIHSVDSLKLLKEINKRAHGFGRTIDCLLQVRIAEEDTKFGLEQHQVREVLDSEDFAEMDHVCVRGLMGMATFTDDAAQVRREFSSLKHFWDELKSTVPSSDRWNPEVLSMGMSGDWELAVEEGSTMVRVGSAIFGQRNYA